MNEGGDDGSADVTVVIPAFNRQDTVARAVLSARLQHPQGPHEVIVVDDGSMDATGAQAAWAGARVVSQANAGEGGARNAGIAAAETTWVAFLDSDDEWLPHHVATLLAAADGHVLVAANARAVPSGRLVGHPHLVPTSVTSLSMLWPESPLSPSAAMVNRHAAVITGGFSDLRLGADRDFWCRLLEHGSGVLLPTVSVVYHEHDGQVSSDVGAMHRARTDLLATFVGRTWFDPAVLGKVEAVRAWDALRRGLRDGQPRTALEEAFNLAGNRSAPRALLETACYRRSLRKR